MTNQTNTTERQIASRIVSSTRSKGQGYAAAVMQAADELFARGGTWADALRVAEEAAKIEYRNPFTGGVDL